MRVEIKNASNFLTNLLRVKCGENADHQLLEEFRCKLEAMLGEHYQQHWFPESPCKGSGYRCIRINHKMDPILSKAGSECGFDQQSLRDLFPHELTLWIDPKEVAYRIGENGSICVLYDGSTVRSSNDHSWEQTPRRNNSASINIRKRVCNSDEESSSCSGSPMSMSPPSPVFDRPPPTCKGTLRENGFIMDPRNMSFEFSTCVSS